MNITFLVGNGFDINLGLKTKYTDFTPFIAVKDTTICWDMLSMTIMNAGRIWKRN